MPRNFYRRVEVMFPIEAAELKDRILHEIVPAYLLDNVKSRILQPDGTYVRMQPAPGEPPYRCQERLLSLRPSGVPEREARAAFAMAASGNGSPNGARSRRNAHRSPALVAPRAVRLRILF